MSLNPFPFICSILDRLRHPVQGDRLLHRTILSRTGSTIVISKFSGWGSLLNIAPLLDGIRRQYPRARIILITDRHNEELVRRLPSLNQTLFLPKIGRNKPVSFIQFMRLAVRLRRIAPQVYLDLQLQTRKSLALNLSLLSGAQVRIGFVGGSDPRRLRSLTHPIYFNLHQATKAVYDQASLLMGIDPRHSSQSVLIEQPADTRHLATVLPEVLDSSLSLCIINPNASESAYERRWPISHFQETVRRLLASHRSLRIVLVGSPDERHYVDTLEQAVLFPMRERVRNMAGRLSFGGLLALLRKGNCFLTNDSGPLHLALSVGTPTVALFGPTHPALIPARPPSSRTIFLYEPHYCSPCVHHVSHPPCGGDNVCLQHLSVDSVVRACDAFLLKNRGTRLLPQEWNTFHPPGVVEFSGHPLGLFRPLSKSDNPFVPSEPLFPVQPEIRIKEQGGG
ncbi:MAG: glycosyltransferase family 9 protein [Leptospirales bacterium]